MNENIYEIGREAKAAASKLALLTTETKNEALRKMAESLRDNKDKIIAANRIDVADAKESGMSGSMLDRLMLDEKRIENMAVGLLDLVDLEDPVGQVEKMWYGAERIRIGRVRVPIGVIGIIYEARPNVTSDVAGISLKTGNAVILRGSKSALRSNIAIVNALQDALIESGLPKAAVSLVTDTSREASSEMMKMNRYIDVLIPRGGAGLIKTVVAESTVPVLETGTGNCHIYVDESADFDMAENIIINAKCQRPGVCNAAESLLVHESVAAEFLPRIGKSLTSHGVVIRGDEETCKLIENAEKASDEDYYTEYCDLIISVKVIKNIDEAIEHINIHGTGHSEAIITNDYGNSRKFTDEVDAAVVYVNASTRFTDGGQFGFGAEMGISTQKLHARGPLGLYEMTTTKYTVYGDGQIRK